MTEPFLFRHQTCHLFLTHAREVIRQPAVIFWGIVFPILISLGLGLAFTQKSQTVYRVGVVRDNFGDAGAGSPLETFLETRARPIDRPEEKPPAWQMTLEDNQLGATRFEFVQTDWQSAMVRIKRGKLNLVMSPAENKEIQYHFDPRNPEAELAYLKLSAAVQGRAETGGTHGRIAPLTVTGTRYIDFLVPGLICMNVMMSCMWGISYGMIDKRSKKLLRRMVATPMKRSHFLATLMAVRIGMNLIEAVLLFVFVCLVFDIAVQGSIGALAALFLAGNIAFCGIAIFTCSRTANTEVGNGLVNAVVMPMAVLSGIFFSYHNFPDWSIDFIQMLPLTIFLDGLRAVFNEGAGFAETGMATAVLAAMGVVFFSMGLRIFKWH